MSRRKRICRTVEVHNHSSVGGRPRRGFRSTTFVVITSLLLVCGVTLFLLPTPPPSRAALTSSENEYNISVGPITGTATADYCYAALFNPLTSTKTAIVRRINVRIDAAALGSGIPVAVRRITAASGGTQIGASDIPKKHSDSSNPETQVFHSGVTTTKVGSGHDARMLFVMAPYGEGSIGGYQDLTLGDNEKLVLQPGEGFCLYQTVGLTVNHRIRLLAEWEEQASPPASQGEYIYSFQSFAETSAPAGYVCDSFFNPGDSGKTVIMKRMAIYSSAVNVGTYVPLTLRRITAAPTAGTGTTTVTKSDIPKKHTGSDTSVVDLKYKDVRVSSWAGNADSRLMSVTTAAAASQPQGVKEIAFGPNDEKLILQAGEGVAVYLESAGSPSVTGYWSMFEWQEVASGSTPASQGEYMITYPAVAQNYTGEIAHQAFFNPVNSGKTAVVKRMEMRIDAVATSVNAIFSVYRISGYYSDPPGGTPITAANVPKKHTGTVDTVMDLRHTGPVVKLPVSNTSKILCTSGAINVGTLQSRKEIHFGNNEKFILKPGEGVALIHSSSLDITNQQVRFAIEWDEESSAPPAQNEYVISIFGTGSTTANYVHAMFWNGSGKYAIVKRISTQIDVSSGTLTYIPFSVRRITAYASGGTAILAADVPKKNTGSVDTALTIYYNGMSVTYPTISRLFTLTGPGAVGSSFANMQLGGHREFVFANDEQLVLAPGEGLVFKQDAATTSYNKTKFMLEWAEQDSNPSQKDEYMYGTPSIAGTTAAGTVYATLMNPSTSLKNYVVKRIETRADRTGTKTNAGYVAATVRRITSSSSGTAQTDAAAKKNSTTGASTVEVRTRSTAISVTYPTGTTASSRITGVCVPGAVGQALGLFETIVTYQDELILKPGEGIALYQENLAGDSNTTFKFNIEWAEDYLTVGSAGIHVLNLKAGSMNKYVGGAFTFIRKTTTTSVTSITVTEIGTVNANSNLSDVKLYYETTDTPDYSGTEALFGSTPSFNASQKATVTGTTPMSVGTSQVCVYVVLNIGSGATSGQTIKMAISTPVSEVVSANGLVTPSTEVAISDSVYLFSTYVTNTDNSGAGSLRQAITDANIDGESDTIDFSLLPGSGTRTITPTTALPALTEASTTIDGYTATDGVAGPLGTGTSRVIAIEINGSSITSDYLFTLSGNSCKIRGLALRGGNHYVHITGNSNTVEGSYLGTRANGTTGDGCSAEGIMIDDNADSNLIGGAGLDDANAGNVISSSGTGGSGHGVVINTDSDTNEVQGNYIGTDYTGTVDLGNASDGIFVACDADNVIGGSTHGEGNLISGNGGYGIDLGGDSASYCTVWGNWIGLNASGSGAVPNANGIGITSGADHDTIGGDTDNKRNVISGNTGCGIVMTTATTTDNSIAGNYIGTDPTGESAVANGTYGIYIYGSPGSTIGGDTSAERNVISGNSQHGIAIQLADSAGIRVTGNYIGTDKDGTTDLGNGRDGVSISSSVTGVYVGGENSGEGNVISGNNWSGVSIGDSPQNYVWGNTIGLDAAGTAAVANSVSGVTINTSSDNNVVGGTTSAKRNVISGNTSHGVQISGTGTSGNTVIGNYIGTNASGTATVANVLTGVTLESGCTSNTIGGDESAERNVISGNTSHGVQITGSGTSSNIVSGNYIGTDKNGTADLGNTQDGVQLYGQCSGNTVGGDSAGEGNLLSGNNGNGASMYDADGNYVQGNTIGLDASGTALPNSYSGITLYGASQSNTIGGDTEYKRNVISGNTQNGITIQEAGTSSNVVIGNYIGTDSAGTAARANGSMGVFLYNGSSGNTVGGDDTGEGNLISGHTTNSGIGIYASSGNHAYGNLIGMKANGTDALPNLIGVMIQNASAGNVIGGSGAGQRNVLSGNSAHGIMITNTGSTDNQVMGNYIGTNSSGSAAVANGQFGVVVYSSCSSNTIGGANSGEGNLVSGNTGGGIDVYTASENNVYGNVVGLNAAGNGAVANGVGIYVAGGAQNNIVGGAGAKKNVVSGNTTMGVQVGDTGTTGNQLAGNYIGTNSSGSGDFGNGQHGVFLYGGSGNTIGGVNTGEGNVISGNAMDGLKLEKTSGNYVWGNTIGLNAAGTSAIPNDSNGIDLASGEGTGTTSTLIGGATAARRNVISGNTGCGVLLQGSGTQGNSVQGNYVGTDSAGTADLGNTQDGVKVASDAGSNTVGGSAAGGNTILYNEQNGVEVLTASCEVSYNTIKDNGGPVQPTSTYYASASPLSWSGTDYLDNLWGDPGCFFLADSDPVPVTADNTEVPDADGTNDFNVALFHDTTADLYQTWYVRADVWTSASSFFDAYEGGTGNSIDRTPGNYYWEEGAFLDQGAGNAYTWEGTPSVVSDYTSPPSLKTVGYAGVRIEITSGATVTDNTIDENVGDGVSITASTVCDVSGNQVRNNDGIGIVVWDKGSYTVLVSENSTYGNGGLGIDLLGDGVTPNDGNNNNTNKPNRGYNFPVFEGGSLVIDESGNATVEGTAPPNSSVEFYLVGEAPDPSDHGQGYEYLKSTTANGDGEFSDTLSGLSAEDAVSAISISPAGDPSGEGNTSEFALNIEVGSLGPTIDDIDQKKTDDTPIATGEWINQASVKFTATASDPSATDTLYLCVENDPIATPFSDVEDATGTGVPSSGEPVPVTVTITGLDDATQYHWQARVKDAAGHYSEWVAYGGNGEAERDFGIDISPPTGGTVYDGITGDQDWNDGSLTVIESNWTGFNCGASGLQKYEYAIRRSSNGDYWCSTHSAWEPGSSWYDRGTNTSVSVTPVYLNTGENYYCSVRASDNAGNTGDAQSSNGQRVTSLLSFSLSSNEVTFADLNSSNNWSGSRPTSVTTSTNAGNGYTVSTRMTQPLTSLAYAVVVDNFYGTWGTPQLWPGGTYGFGYTSNDPSVQGSNRFAGGTKYAAYSPAASGDIVADHTDPVTGFTGAVTNEAFIITSKVAVNETQVSSTYRAYLLYVVTANY